MERLQCAPPAGPVGLLARSDPDLIALFGQDARSFAEISRRHQPGMQRIASKVCGPLLAEDVVQDVLERLWRQPERFDPDRGALGAFLAIQTRNRAIDVFRSETSRHAREDAHWPEPGIANVETEALIATDAAEMALRLQSLPPNEQQVIALAYFAGNTYKGVAELLGLPEGTVKTIIRRGLQRLRLGMINPNVHPVAVRRD